MGSRPGAPAEVYQLIFGVEVDVTGGRLGSDNGGFTGRLSSRRDTYEQRNDRLNRGEFQTRLTSKSQIPALKVMIGDIDMMQVRRGEGEWQGSRDYVQIPAS